MWKFNENCRMLILRGMSGSGKSTYARQIVEENPEQWEIVSRDTLREQFLGKTDLERYFEQGLNQGVEEVITNMEHEAIARVLAMGKGVIIDNTNIQPRYIAEYCKIAIDFGLYDPIYGYDGVDIHNMPFDDVDIAYERIQQRGERFVSKEVLQRQKDQLKSFPAGYEFSPQTQKELNAHKPRKWFLPPFGVKKYCPKEGTPKAIICDLDGTLAHRALLKEPYIHYRSFYEYGKCETDEVDPLVKDVLMGLYDQGYRILFVTGRKKDCLTENHEFIQRATGLDYDKKQYLLFHRDEDIDVHEENGRMLDDSDDIVKSRLFDTYIRDFYDVRGVLDDRKRVVAFWEALGIRVLNVGKLNEEF